MSVNPYLSIIVPHLNRPDMLRALISSVPDSEEIEVIVVDDGSDELPQIHTHPDNLQLKIVRNLDGQKFAGTARNFGIDIACGQYLYFADSDDLLDPYGVATCLEILKDRQTDVLYTKATCFRDDGREGFRHLPFNAIVDKVLVTESPEALIRFHSPWGKFIRRDFVEENRLRFQDTRYSNDVMFNAWLYFAAPVVQAADIVTYHIREGNDSLTSSPNVVSIRQRLDVMTQYNDLLRANGMKKHQVGAISQIRSIAARHPIQALKMILSVKLRGTPLIGHPANILRVLKRQFRKSPA